MKKKSTKETPTELSEAYVINAYKDGIEEDEDTDVHVRFDGYRIGLSFNDGNGYLIIFDELLSALNELADDAGWEAQGVEELEKLLKAAQKVLKKR